MRSLGQVQDAEDVTQRVFIAAWRRRETYDPQRARLSAWLVGITRREIADAHAARARTAAVDIDAVEERSADAPELTDRLLVADEIARLSPQAARLLRRPHAPADRRAPRPAARHREEPHPPQPRADAPPVGGG
jgi:RNA polymerase sigma factor (sigma-70 family)